MKNTKRIFAGLAALSIIGSLTACGGGSDTAETTAETTTQATVEINTEPLSEEDAGKVNDVADTLTGELENKTIKWFSFYDPFHASTSGNTKALSLELFETKYGGEIEYIHTEWAQRFDTLATNIIGGTGIDFIAADDLDFFPRGVAYGQMQSFDAYMDWENPLWSEWKDLNNQFTIGDSHYLICLQSTVDHVVFYNKSTIENFGFDDPAELLENGEWTWDTFRGMLMDYCDDESEQFGLDGWFNEQPIMLTSGVPSVELRDGKLVHNLNNPTLERVMNFMQELNTSGLIRDKNIHGWNEHPEYIGEGKEIFYIGGSYLIESAPEIWSANFGNPDDVMFVPLPKDPEADNHYIPAGIEAYALCKGAQNPDGVMRFMECILAANSDERTQEIARNKRINDYGWNEEKLEMHAKITEMARENPVYDLHAGCPVDLYNLLDSGETGIRAAFVSGLDWATVRESNVDAVETYIVEFNGQLESIE